MIPKKIHYCWFGGKTMPKLATKCINSWKKYCPEYEIIEWNEKNFDIRCCQYVEEAYNAEKWAFVSDYARFKILYENGGLYFDTDVELLKSIDDVIKKGPFMACELDYNKTVNPGLGLGAEKNNLVLKELLDGYENRKFLLQDGKFDLTTIVEYTTKIMKKYGLKNGEEIQKIKGINIYPKEFFNPHDFDTGQNNCTEKTYSIHHYAASWTSARNKINTKIHRCISRISRTIFKRR